MKRLTEKQKSILSFIRVYIAKMGYSPTVREIGNAFGMRSTNGVSDHLKALERKGRLKRIETMPRGIELVEVPLKLRFCGVVE
ncbi:LexA family protein [Gimesia fumaroli]|uniref:LexA repressor n=1 Tax=Gimesia fumaroli TaxID=2527976 RepID=A0A518IKR2_9PLAN|nr:LexA family transcriptional regulator [Gimesia fumaroli]QDV53683.1 LexA repressor [Gimesia fumaroli]